MDKLQSVPQESKSDLLQPGPAPKLPQSERLPCQWILEKQDRKGQPCGRDTFNNAKYCPPHLTKAAMKEQKEEITHNINASQQQFAPLPLLQPTQIYQQLPIQQAPTYHQPPQPQESMIPSSVMLEVIRMFSSAMLEMRRTYQD